MSAPVVMRFYSKPEDMYCKYPVDQCDEYVRGADYDQLAAENARLREALEEAAALAQHHIPGYAYGDNEAACEMADRLRCIAAISPAPAKKENEHG